MSLIFHFFFKHIYVKLYCRHFNQNSTAKFRLAHLEASTRQFCNMIRCISKTKVFTPMHCYYVILMCRCRDLFLGRRRQGF